MRIGIPIGTNSVRQAILALAVLLGLSWHDLSVLAANIEFTSTQVDTIREDAFRLRLAVKATEVAVGSFGLRTVEPCNIRLPGFVASNGYQYLASRDPHDKPAHLLLDNGPNDEDPSPGTFAMTVSTHGWPDGTYRLLAYADNRPAPGAYVSARAVVEVVIADGKINRTKTRIPEVKITRFQVEPTEVKAGETFRVSGDCRTSEAGTELALTCPYTVGPDEVPPGFEYDAQEKFAWFRKRQPDGTWLVPTGQWKPGVYHLTLRAGVPGIKKAAGLEDYRDFSVKVSDPNSRFRVQIQSRVLLGPGTHFSDFCKLQDGSVLAHGKVSRDGGRTWQALRTAIPMAHQLRSGMILGLAMSTEPAPERPGHFLSKRFLSNDGGRTVKAEPTEIHVPQATGGIGHAPFPGPVFWRSIVEQPDGSLLAAMYGWFKGDESPVPGQPGSMRYRTFVVLSRDQGKTWEYLATVAYDPKIGTEGYCEPVIRGLPDGTMIAMLRTGGNNRPFWQDNPLCQTQSTDGGKTWVSPHRTGVEGVAPDLYAMSDGTLACSYGRPGADLMLSADQGRTWTDHTCIDAERYSGYTAVCEVSPGVLLYGYGVMNCLDPSTGRRSNQLWVARITVETQR